MFPVCDVIPQRKTPYVTLALILSMAVVALYTARLDPATRLALAYNAGIVPRDPSWPALVTSAFVQPGLLQAAVSLLYLWLFGPTVEGAIGRVPFLLVCTAGAVVTGAAYRALNPSSLTPLLGAGGPIAAVMGVYFVLYPRSQILTLVVLPFRVSLVELPAVAFAMFWLLLQVIGGLDPIGARPSDVLSALAGYTAAFLPGAGVGLLHRGRTWPTEGSG